MTHFSTDDGSEGHLRAGSGQRTGRGSARWLLVSGIVAAVLIAAGAVYWFGLRTPTSKPKPAAATSQKATAPTRSPAEAAAPIVFKSTTLNLELTHRTDWTVRESTDKNEIILTSPTVTYPTVDGTSKDGVFTLKVRRGVSDAMLATIQKAIASKDSEVIGYTNPTENQRFYTNVSYAGDKADRFNFFIITGSMALKAGGPFADMLVLGSDTYLFAGGYGQDSTDALIFDAVPPGGATSAVTAQALDIVKSIRIF